MIVNLSVLTFAATLLSSQTLVSALSPSEIPTDTPISSLLSSANAHLAKGETNDALIYYDVAISRDPNDYLTFFKRGATYLSLGRMAQATRDFDKVLTIRPDFEGALLQRAKIRAKHAEWDAAMADYLKAGKAGSPEVLEMEEAKGAASLATDAEKAGDWEKCVEHAGVAIMVASRSLSLRQTRVHCRFEKGEVQEGINDLAHVLQMQPGLTEPHMQISSILFYALKDTERGLKQIKQCLHADPDSKVCKKLHKREKQLEKQLVKINKAFEKKQYATGLKYLIASGDEPGLIQEVKDDVKELRESGTIPAKAPNDLVARAVEMACEAYYEMNSHKKAIPYCDEALSMYPQSLHGLLSKAQRQMDLENFEDAVRILNEAKEHHPSASQLPGLQQKAEIALKRSKTKDYYKVLGVAHDADERQIKQAYRKMTKEFHPDKRHMNGVSKEDAEKKMASINEAYEVLSDPELRARFDRGDDPNDQESGRGQPFQGSPFGGQQFVFQNGRPAGGHQFNFKFGGGAGGFPFGN